MGKYQLLQKALKSRINLDINTPFFYIYERIWLFEYLVIFIHLTIKTNENQKPTNTTKQKKSCHI